MKNMPDMDQMERIVYYEELMNRVNDAVRQLEAAAKAFDGVYQDVAQLEQYLGSSEWRQDFEDDAAGKFPEGLRRGVLSEDGLYNLLQEYREQENDCRTKL